MVAVKIKTLSGRTFNLDLDPSTTVEAVKKSIQEKEGVDPLQQRLIYNGVALSNSDSINSIGYVERRGFIHMVLVLRG